MTTWRLARLDLTCGNCRAAIAAGQPFLEYHISARTLVRCQACGESMTGESAPDSLEADAPPAPLTVGHQPSLGLEPVGAVATRSAWRRRFQR